MSDLHQQLVRMVDKMPAFPGSVNQILQMTSAIDCAPKDLVQVIEHDPVMMAKILKLVNSAYFGLSREITSIKHGVVFVGLNTIKNLAISIATMGMLPKTGPAGLDMNSFLLHSLGTASIAKLLGKRLGGSADKATDYFVGGLLHDIGKVVFAQFMPQEMERALKRVEMEGVSLSIAETIEIGADHTQLGGMLAEKWQLPHTLVTCIKEHHNQELQGDTDNKVLDCVVAANIIVKRIEFGCAGNLIEDELPDHVSARFGMDLDELQESIENLDEELEKVNAFIRV